MNCISYNKFSVKTPFVLQKTGKLSEIDPLLWVV